MLPRKARLWSKGGERGLYQTIDGGANWDANPGQGALDWCHGCRHRPRQSRYNLRRNAPATIAPLRHCLTGGPESGIHKSSDGGESWTELKTGIPGGDKGKIGLAISPQKSNVVYATIEMSGSGQGFYRSEEFRRQLDQNE